MRWCTGITICLTFVCLCVQAQRNHYGLIRGTVIDSFSHRPLESASITVFLMSDSSIVNYTLSDAKGEFTITNIPLKTGCSLIITMEGYNNISLSFILSLENKEKRLDNIQLIKAYTELKAVSVQALRPPIAVKQDTLEFNVSSFKTMPNAMLEDLLKQLPGVEVDKDGNIIINGKKVTKIMLDGREFFGGDPKIAIKNLPKDIIEKLQVMDNKSPDAQFNKTANRIKDLTINLTLKKEIQKEWFGRVSAGYGSTRRCEGDAMLNFFNGSKQLNFIGNTNNTNRGSISGNDFNISNASSTLKSGGGGLTRATSGGVNFNDNIWRQLKLNGSYFYINSHTNNSSQLQRKNNLPDTSFYYSADNSNTNNYTNHRLSLNLQYNIDTLTEMHINSHVNSNLNDGVVLNKASSSGMAGQLINTSENTYSSNAGSKNIISEFFFSHRFRKSGRGVTLGLSYTFLDASSINDNFGKNDYYKSGANDSTDLINQRSLGKNSSRILSFTATYAEPLSKCLTAILTYNYNRNTSISDKNTNRFNSSTGKYDIEDSAYTNAFRNVTESQNPDINLSFNKDKYQAAIGSGLQLLQQDNLVVTTETHMHKSYLNFTPSANLVYIISKTGSISIYYTGRSQQPSIEQLQPVPDNSNPLYLQLGNRDLRPSFFHNIDIKFRKSNVSNYWFTGINYNTTQNQIINETWFDDLGKQVSQPKNINGNYSMSVNVLYSRTWKKGDATLSMNIGSNVYLNRNNYFENKIQIPSNKYSFSQSVRCNFTYKQLLNIMPSFYIRYSKTHYSSQSIQDVDFNTRIFSVSSFWNYPKWLIVENNLEYNYNSQIAAGFSKNVMIWSSAINCLLLKNKKVMLRISVYDILKQNTEVYRIMTGTYIEDRQTQVLPRYFLLSYIYNFKKL